jgi:thymidylate synthase (FAD)
VQYIGHLGDDTRIVQAARVSYQQGTKGEEADRKLLAYLFKHRHTSPFEQCNVSFEIKMPIFVMRQFVRHRTFRLNEWSGRYSELEDEFYKPELWRVQDTKNKQGSIMQTDETWNRENDALLDETYRNVFFAYRLLLERGVAKELARIVLPVGIYTIIHVNVDLHNLMHFLNLRLDPHAQKEIQDVAVAMKQIAHQLFPWTMELFDKYQPAIIDRPQGEKYNGFTPEED